MNIDDIIKTMADNSAQFTLYRSFLDINSSATITKRLNDLVNQNPDYQDIVIALSILPALEWMIAGKEVNEVINKVYSSDVKVAKLSKVQTLISNSSKIKPSLYLDNRVKYFENCEKLINCLKKSIEAIKTFPSTGKHCFRLLSVFIERPQKSLSPYFINTYIEDAIAVLYDKAGDEVSELLDKVMFAEEQSDVEMAYIYHNTELLLREYNRILWSASNSDDKAMKLLSCQTEEEMMKITMSDSKYSQAYLIVEYIKLVRGAISIVRAFPCDGPELYQILMAMLKMKARNATDSEIADYLGLSQASYSRKKKKALSVLGAILWGCDCDAFFYIISKS